MSADNEDRDDASHSFEVDRDDQPQRDDLIDPDDISPGESEPAADREAGVLPDPDDLPVSQEDNVLDAERLTEDASNRPLPTDEEA